MEKRCFFYIVNKIGFVHEAALSSISAKYHMPDISTVLFSPLGDAVHSPTFDTVISLPMPKHDLWFLDQVDYMSLALSTLIRLDYKEVCYLDCDTFVCAPVYELFDMLKIFHLMGAHAPGRQTTYSFYFHDLPPVFPELNIGVNPMRCDGYMSSFWNAVYRMYVIDKDKYGDNDQGALRDALWTYWTTYKFYVLPPEYNLRFNFPCFVSGQAKILHGHGANQNIADQINANQGMRVWYQNHLCTT